jgi:hypothetical protein
MFSELRELALEVMSRHGTKVHMVSGPITTGGLGDPTLNLKLFVLVIEHMHESGAPVFSQMPFERKMGEFQRHWYRCYPNSKYCTPILEDFYGPVMGSGMVHTLNFIPDWHTSFGARWEHERCAKWKIRRRYLPQELVFQMLTKIKAKKA